MELMTVCEVLPGRVACLEVTSLLPVRFDAILVLEALPNIAEHVVSFCDHVLSDAHSHPLV